MTPTQAQLLIPGNEVLFNHTIGGFKRIRKVVRVDTKVWETFSGVPFCWVYIEVIIEKYGRKFREIHGVSCHNIKAYFRKKDVDNDIE